MRDEVGLRLVWQAVSEVCVATLVWRGFWEEACGRWIRVGADLGFDPRGGRAAAGDMLRAVEARDEGGVGVVVGLGGEWARARVRTLDLAGRR